MVLAPIQMSLSWQLQTGQTYWRSEELKSKKVENLFFTGQLSVPGPGVPPALISGKLVAGLIAKKNN